VSSLEGLRVLDISNVIAGPFAAALLADFGADVVKAELPGGGDALRALPPHKDGKPLLWKAVNRNKRAITLDLRKPEGQELFKRLLPRFDVLIENYRPGTLDRWDLPREALWKLQPKLTILRVTGFGQTGPYRGYAGFARLFEAYSGLTYITGEPDGAPTHPSYPIGDPISGVFGAFGVLVALVHRMKHPDAPGQEIDLSCTEAVMRLLEVLPIEYEQLGLVHERTGSSNAFVAPAGVFRSGDGEWVTFTAATQSVFARFCALIERKDLLSDPRFADNPSRMSHLDELNEIVARWIGARPLGRGRLAALGSRRVGRADLHEPPDPRRPAFPRARVDRAREGRGLRLRWPCRASCRGSPQRRAKCARPAPHRVRTMPRCTATGSGSRMPSSRRLRTAA
jgi:crotonobetainyl-CoA:carnitine CoA-transferase CaiB-like acyl-CoA transferase